MVPLVLVAMSMGEMEYRGPVSEGPFQGPTEHEVKAAFLYNFAVFVQWPEGAFANAESPVVFAVVGVDPFGRVLDASLANKRVHNRPIEIRRFRSVRDVDHCHVLFVPRSESGNVRRIVQRTQDSPVLLVGEHAGFAQEGGVINFYLERNRIRFEINPEEAKERELRVSSKLLKLARIVTTSESP